MLGFGFCCCGCNYFSDDFERADGTDLGDQWTEVAGDWSIASGKLTTADSDAYAECLVENELSAARYQVSVKIAAQDGDQVRLYADGANVCLEIEIGEYSRARLYDGAILKGSVDIPATEDLRGEEFTLVLCCDDEKITAKLIATAVTTLCSMPVVAASSVCGVGTGTIGETSPTFDDFTLTKNVQDDAACATCGDECTYLLDDFRQDDLSPADWEVVSGEWTTGTGSVTGWCDDWAATESTPGLILSNTFVPDADGAFTVEAVVEFGGNGPGSEARLIADYQDADNYVYVSFWRVDPPSPMGQPAVGFGFHIVSGGVDTTVYETLGTAFSTGTAALWIHYDNGVLQAFVNSYLAAGSSNRINLADIPYTPATSRVGLWGNPAGDPLYYTVGSIRFCLVQGERVRNTAGDCPEFGSPGSGCSTCADGTWRHTIQVRLAGIGGSQCDDCEAPWTLDLKNHTDVNGHPVVCSWFAPGPIPCGLTLQPYTVYCGVSTIAGGFRVAVSVYNPLGYLVALFVRDVIAGSLDCSDLAGSLSPSMGGVASDAYCDWSSATCAIWDTFD